MKDGQLKGKQKNEAGEAAWIHLKEILLRHPIGIEKSKEKQISKGIRLADLCFSTKILAVKDRLESLLYKV